ncbi:MAG: hypothetical protein JXB15_16750 [Anaerolineales bacterium]|nr:hypothetical protein [Anaerolineales bacterium]
MRGNVVRLFQILVSLLILVSLAGCDTLFPAAATATLVPTNTAVPTNTQPPPTDTPMPTATFTEAPTPSPTMTLLPTLTIAPTVPTSTPEAKNAIVLYYFNLKEKGQYGCNEALWYINTGIAQGENLVEDIKLALRRILSYRGETIGILYNPGYASQLAIGDVIVEPGGPVNVWLTGTWNRTKDPCDGPRLRDQLRVTVRQFPEVKSRPVNIYINGVTIGDVIGRK